MKALGVKEGHEGDESKEGTEEGLKVEGVGGESPRLQYHGTWGDRYDEDEWLERRRISMVRRKVELVLGGGGSTVAH